MSNKQQLWTHTDTHRITKIHSLVQTMITGEHINTHFQHTHIHTWCVKHRWLCKYTCLYIHPHALKIYPCSCGHTYAQTEVEYEMNMCNYMANVVMIWCLNISTVLCCAGTLAISSHGQAQRQQHKKHEREYVHPTRELPIQPEIFMTSSLLKPPRRHSKENQWEIHHKSGGGKRWMEQEGKPLPQADQDWCYLNLSCPEFLFSLHQVKWRFLKNYTVGMTLLTISISLSWYTKGKLIYSPHHPSMWLMPVTKY